MKEMVKIKNYLEMNDMKIFVSWSGSLSNKIAEAIKKWLPCLINSVDVFFSSEDIEKGENWDSKISSELSDCKYGIICLTKENVSAPWINFEAGAIAKALDSKVATLMINVNPSDVKGPLSRYQGTKTEREDFYQLIQDINKQCDSPIPDNVLKNTFDALWDKIQEDFETCISSPPESFSFARSSQLNSPDGELNCLVATKCTSCAKCASHAK